VKVTCVPGHIDVAEGLILTAGVTNGFILMVTEFEVAVGEVAHPIVVVITQLTTSALFKVLLVKVDPVAAFTPFTFH
jgi:hypothetical protein